jgi:hypothetical protein
MKRFGHWLVRSWTGRSLLALLVAVASAVGFFLWRRQQAGADLRAALDELDRTEPGWRLDDLEAARAKIADADNSAPLIARTAQLLGDRWRDADFDHRFEGLEPEEQLTAAQLVSLRWKLDGLRPALDEARKIADKPNGRHPLQYRTNTLDTRMERQAETREVVALLRYDAWLRAHEGDRRGAATACRAVFHVARSLGDEPLLISQMIRVAEDALACGMVERALAQGELELNDLTALQHLAENEERHPALEIALCGERAMMHALFEALESGAVTMDELGGGKKQQSFWDAVTSPWVQLRIRSEHPLYLSWINEAVAAARLPDGRQEEAFRALDQRFQAEKSRAIVATLLMNAVTIVEPSFRRTRARLRCLAVALAAERYRLTHHAWPDSLDCLTPDFLSAVPLDPYDGEPLRFRRTDEGVVVYSVGEDRVDNDGELSLQGEPGTDLGDRLFDERPLVKAPPPLVGPPEPPEIDPDEPPQG